MLTDQGRWARSRRFLFVQAMSEEQLKAAEAEATAEQEEGSGEEISEEDLAGVAGGVGGVGGVGYVGIHGHSSGEPLPSLVVPSDSARA